MYPTHFHHRLRALGLALMLSVTPSGRALSQMAPELSALISATRDQEAPPTAMARASTSLTQPLTVEEESARASAAAAEATLTYPRAQYAGRDDLGVPRYLERRFSDDERRLLREQFGIEEPGRLYLSDTLPGGVITYDTARDRGERDLVSSYRVGAPSVRRPGETWEDLERRLAVTDPGSFPASARRVERSLDSLDALAKLPMVRLLAAARRAGFRVRVVETRRSAERQAYLLTLDGHLTHTATSRHAEGLAVDVVVDDGDLSDAATRRHWTAFRRWIVSRAPGAFRLIGAPDRSWDWPHIEFVTGSRGFQSIEALLDAARACAANGATDCTAAWRATAESPAIALAE